MFFYFSKACMAPNKPTDYGIFASRTGWSTMVTVGDPAVNGEKTIFMKRQGSDIVIHGLFVTVDDMIHVPTCDKLRDEFLTLYQNFATST